MAEERTVTTWTLPGLGIITIDGQPYLRGAWPEEFKASYQWLTQLDPRRHNWNGKRLSLYLENTHATYYCPDFDPNTDPLTFQRGPCGEVKAIPGDDGPPAAALDAAAQLAEIEQKFRDMTAPEVMPDGTPPIKVGGKVWTPQGHQQTTTADFTSQVGVIPTLANPVFPPPTPMERALMAASNPKSVRPPTGPIFGTEGLDTERIAHAIINTPGWMDSVYARMKAENLMRGLTQPRPIPPFPLANVYGPNTLSWTNQYVPVTPQPKTVWTDYLTDVAAFLKTAAEGLGYLERFDFKAQHTGSDEVVPAELVVQDPAALEGRARLENLTFGDIQPRVYPVRSFIGALATTARLLAGRAEQLRRVAAPEESKTDEQRRLDRVDAEVVKEVEQIVADLGKEKYPEEWGTPNMSGFALVDLRHDAWDAWAKREAAALTAEERTKAEGEAGREWLRDMADISRKLEPGEELNLVCRDGPAEAFVVWETGRSDDPSGWLSETTQTTDDGTNAAQYDDPEHPPVFYRLGETADANGNGVPDAQEEAVLERLYNDPASYSLGGNLVIDEAPQHQDWGGNGQMGGNE